MALASIYFDPVLNRVALILTAIASIVGRILAFVLQTCPDKNYPSWYGLIVFAIIPNLMMLLALGFIFSALAKNTNAMMSSLLDAEEQERMLDHMKKLTGKSSEVSKGLSEGMKTLTDVTQNSMEANGEILNSTIAVVDGIQNSVTQLNVAEENSERIYESVQKLVQESDEITQLFINVETLSDENKLMMQRVTSGMEKVKASTDICQEAMKQLEEKTKSIDRIVDTIADISEQTDLLSLNAAIESARAGEQGKGFAVVSEEIRKLSQQTQKTLMNVRQIINELLEQNSIAVNSMNQTILVHEEQKDVIGKAEQSAQDVMLATKEMTEKMKLIAHNTKYIEKSTGEIVSIVTDVTRICKDNQDSLDVVTSSVDSGAQAMKQLEQVVESIHTMSDELAVVVQS